MPSTSKKQHNFMAAVAKNPGFAKKVGIPRSVGQEFLTADKGKTFKKGGEMKESKMMVKKEIGFMKKKGAPKSMIKHEMAEAGMKKGGMTKHEDIKMDKKVVKKAVGMHDKQQHGGKKTNLSKLASGGLSAGHKSANGIVSKGKTKGAMIKMNKGGRTC